jgi:hypothetical protein
VRSRKSSSERRWRLAVLGVANSVATVGMVIQSSIKPTDFAVNLSGAWLFFVLILPAAAVGLLAERRVGVGVVALVQATSFLWLLPGALHGDSQNMAILIWWTYLPMLAWVIVLIDRALARRSTRVAERPVS